ncbi:hypothetical protein GGP87_003031 [Salinibacter ruber]|nr:hypothetical protein [Salinibacter ruber]
MRFCVPDLRPDSLRAALLAAHRIHLLLCAFIGLQMLP